MDTREYYAIPTAMTDVGDHASDVAKIEPAIRSVVAAVQDLLIYDVAAKWLYDVDLPPERADEVNLRHTYAMLDRAVELSSVPVHSPRPPAERALGRCRDYAVLTVAILRAHNIAARARCGFATYFVPGGFEDHWVAEYWNDTEQRWIMVDAQLDEAWCNGVGFRDDPFNIRADQFIIAPVAWQRCRNGTMDPNRCGLTAINEHGLHWVASNTALDFASLNKIEMLPWDVFAEGWEPGQPVPDDLSHYDEVAALCVDPDAHCDELLTRYATDPRFQMKGTVFNVMRQGFDAVELYRHAYVLGWRATDRPIVSSDDE